MDWTGRIGGRVKMRELHILLSVAEAGSMAEAARNLAVSQPVVSKTIATLEHTLKVRLFDRTPNGVELTMYGETLLKRGIAVFDELRAGMQDIATQLDPTVDKLRIGCNLAIGTGLLAAALSEILLKWPRITFEVKFTDVPALSYRNLREREVDLILGRFVGTGQDDVDEEVLFQEQLHVVAAVGSKWSRRRKCELKDLLDERWIMPSHETFAGSLIAEAFRASGLSVPQIALASDNSVHLQNALVAGSDFLTVLPGSYLHFAYKQFGLKALPIKLPIAPRPVGVVTLRNRTIGPVANLFRQFIREFVKPFASSPTANTT